MTSTFGVVSSARSLAKRRRRDRREIHGTAPRRSRRRNPLAATCNPIFFWKDLRLGGEASRTIRNSATITKAGTTRRTNALHRTGTAIPFLHSRGYERVSAARTRAVDISSSPYEKPRVPIVRANREVCVGFETKTPLICCRCYAPRPKAKNTTERQTEETVESPRKAHLCSFSPRRSGEKRCRSIPTMRPPPWLSLGHPSRGTDPPRVGSPVTKPNPP